MGLLTRDQILRAQDIRRETVDVPEWGGQVLVQAMSAADRDAFETSLQKRTGEGRKAKITTDTTNFRAKLAARCIVNENGDPLFEPADIGKLGRKSAAALERVLEVARRLAGMTDEDAEELEKNSVETPEEDSSSD